ncbi:hypothetical protein [Nostoc commune]|nr:hypothetical protein [Nostoc commune]
MGCRRHRFIYLPGRSPAHYRVLVWDNGSKILTAHLVVGRRLIISVA